MTVEAIKEVIAGLPEEERHSLAVWLNELDYDDWDKQMVKDFSSGGRGAHLVERIDREIDHAIATGNVTSLDEGLRTRREQRARK
jgi:hypothetical protein